MKLVALSVKGWVFPSKVKLPATSLTLSPSNLNWSVSNLAVRKVTESNIEKPVKNLSKKPVPLWMESVKISIVILPVLAARSNANVPSF